MGLDALSFHFGINDTQHVASTVQNLSSNVTLGILFLVVGAISEELFFRGIVYRYAGKTLSVLTFALVHAGYFSLIEIVGALLAGIILVHAREKYDSLFPGLIGHFLYNIVVVFLL